MSDPGATYTDRSVRGLEQRLREVYREAERDIKMKTQDFWDKYRAKDAIHRKELQDEKITKADYDAWVRGQVFQGKQWRAKKKQIQETLYNANKIATNMINGQMTNVFTANANYMSYSLEHDAGVNFGFGVYDSATVTNLIKNDPQLLPKWKIDEKKDYIWNGKKVNTQITQGIIQGEKLDQIAKRLSVNLCSQNKSKMLTFARTAMTGAQNSGRQFSLNDAKGKGINVQKEWMATLDGRTRDAHRELDGQKVPLDKPFKVDGEEIMFPGDPTAKARLVYNCRCTMVGDLVDYPSEYQRYDNINGTPIKNMTYRQWEAAKTGGAKAKPQMPRPVSPVRPKRENFDTEEDYQKAREEYRANRELYNKQSEDYINMLVNEPRQYTTPESFQKWADEMGIHVDESFYETDPLLWDEIVNTTNEMTKRFPQVLDFWNNYVKVPYTIDYNKDAVWDYEASHGLTVGSVGPSYKDATKLQLQMANGTDFVYSPDGRQISTLRHEFGHNLDAALRSKFNTLELHGIYDKEEIQRRHANNREYEQELIKLTLEHGTDYSKTNVFEAFAEGFAEYTTNPGTEYAKAFEKFINKWL